jgi:hypothetical protein
LPVGFGVKAFEVGGAEEEAGIEVLLSGVLHGEVEGDQRQASAPVVGVDGDVLRTGDTEEHRRDADATCRGIDADGAVDDADVGDGLVVVFDDGAERGMNAVPAAAVGDKDGALVGVGVAEEFDEGGVECWGDIAFIDETAGGHAFRV